MTNPLGSFKLTLFNFLGGSAIAVKGLKDFGYGKRSLGIKEVAIGVLMQAGAFCCYYVSSLPDALGVPFPSKDKQGILNYSDGEISRVCRDFLSREDYEKIMPLIKAISEGDLSNGCECLIELTEKGIDFLLEPAFKIKGLVCRAHFYYGG